MILPLCQGAMANLSVGSGEQTAKLTVTAMFADFYQIPAIRVSRIFGLKKTEDFFHTSIIPILLNLQANSNAYDEPTRREIIPLRGQSYVSRLPKY
jgi:hypothetical protein